MNDVADALFQQSVSKTRLPLLPFDQWFSSIQVRGEALNTDELQYIVRDSGVRVLYYFLTCHCSLLSSSSRSSGGLLTQRWRLEWLDCMTERPLA
jgi:hypothetical protein